MSNKEKFELIEKAKVSQSTFYKMKNSYLIAIVLIKVLLINWGLICGIQFIKTKYIY